MSTSRLTGLQDPGHAFRLIHLTTRLMHSGIGFIEGHNIGWPKVFGSAYSKSVFRGALACAAYRHWLKSPTTPRPTTFPFWQIERV